MDKQALRERVWDALEESGEARFPFPPHGRIPNFNGSREAADRLAGLDAWHDAETVKANPDAPQLPARRRALREGTTVYMAVPRLRDERCFLELDPARLEAEGVDTDDAATIGGSDEHGVAVYPDDLPEIDLILAGSVAVTEDGRRVGKGEGYSDLEFAILREFGLVDDETTTVTTVHELQVVDDVETDAHDVPLDDVVTPERVVETGASAKPSGIDWGALGDEKRAEIPVLERLLE
ncbi:5-formyltetrahydrofolate cyclo-ligase [Halorarius litoreus]|uniref:5-formyltetrahydrofolate cyclo-ligase n=1 Tax=Halorarius litoreus TaxID=2962676 RepID=UPI0020CF3FB6|nr:5-formyltetrahydrofolate cyclo-ligase [Halorarius litoreus]